MPRLPRVVVFLALLRLATPLHAAAAPWPAIPSHNPYRAEKNQYDCEVLVVGGSSGGVAAAITAGRLGLDTIYVLRAPRDVAGLLGCCMNIDSDLPMRYLGGLPAELDLVARVRSNLNYADKPGHGAGFSAPPHVHYAYLKAQLDALPNVRILADYYPVGVEKEPTTHRVAALRFRHRNDASQEIVVRPRVTIDAEVEGDVMALAGVSWTLKREGRHPDADPTRDHETYAGQIYATAKQPPKVTREMVLTPATTNEADTTEHTMGWNAILILKQYRKPGGAASAPWVLKDPPAGYEQMDHAQFPAFSGIATGMDHYRSIAHRDLSYIEGWRGPDGRHVLLSMDIQDREDNEKKHLAHALGALYYLQHEKGKTHMGLSDQTLWEGLPPKYTLKDFGIASYGGDMPLPSLIYMREGRRMVNDHVYGGKLIEDDGGPRAVQPRPAVANAAFFNAMLIDLHGVSRPPGHPVTARPEGWALLRILGLNHFGVPSIPFDVFLPRPGEATDLLVANAGAYTHEAYAAFPRMEPGRIIQGQACAVLAYHAVKDKTPTHQTAVEGPQVTLLRQFGLSLAYLPDAFSGTARHVVDQLLATRGIPDLSKSDPQDENAVTGAQAAEHLAKLGLTARTSLPTDDKPLSLPDALATLAFETEAPARPVRFSEWKRLLFNAAFAEPRSLPPVTLNLAPALVWDTFTRADGEAAKPEFGPAYAMGGAWSIQDAALCAPAGEAGGQIWTTVDAPALAVACDLNLEQTRTGTAGILLRDPTTGTTIKTLLGAREDALTLRVQTESAAGATALGEKPLGQPHKRGFHLDVVLDAEDLRVLVDGREIQRLDRPALGRTLEVGLTGEPGLPSWFDNLEIHAGWRPWPTAP